MSFRDELKKHLYTYPFDAEMLKARTSTAYGMDLFIEPEFNDEYPGVSEIFLNLKKFYSYRDIIPAPDEIDFVVIWGVSESDTNGVNLFNYAKINQKPILIIEDGFLRSFYPMSFGEVSASLRYDSIGCYYDCCVPSSIENFLNSDFVLDSDVKKFSDILINKLIEHNITKYSAGDLYIPTPNVNNLKKVLVVDQVYGDMSIQLGGIKDSDFTVMLESAISENPSAEIIVKLHPEAVLGIRKGHYDQQELKAQGITVITNNINSISLLKHIDVVYCATTQMGFEALMCGKEVHVFGKPFYSGWGCTIDRQYIPRRNKSRSINDLFYAAYMYNTVYFNPITKLKTDIADVIDYFIEYMHNFNYIQKITQKRIELRLLRLEKKIQEIEPLKETAITLDKHIYEIRNNIILRFFEKINRFLIKFN